MRLAPLGNGYEKAFEGAPKHRPLLSFFSKNPIGKVDPEQKGMWLLREVGNQAKNVMSIVNKVPGVTAADTMLGRTSEEVKHNFQDARTYVKGDFRYKRSLLGQGLAVAGTTGAGFGALDAATATNDDGTPASLPKKLMTGASTSLKWSVGAPIMGAKATFYDIPKMIINPES